MIFCGLAARADGDKKRITAPREAVVPLKRPELRAIDKLGIICYSAHRLKSSKAGGWEFFAEGQFGFSETIPRKDSRLSS
jgi:hypothetical protein